MEYLVHLQGTPKKVRRNCNGTPSKRTLLVSTRDTKKVRRNCNGTPSKRTLLVSTRDT